MCLKVPIAYLMNGLSSHGASTIDYLKLKKKHLILPNLKNARFSIDIQSEPQSQLQEMM